MITHLSRRGSQGDGSSGNGQVGDDIIIHLDGCYVLETDTAEYPGVAGHKLLESGEDDPTALIREVKEETGYDIIPDTIREFGEVEEKRLSKHEPMIWHQTNRLYLCDVYPDQGQCSYTEKERVRGYRQVLFSLDDAIEQNKRVLEREGVHTWNQREYKTMLLIRERLFGNEDRT